jgi:hypothetical protein
MGGQTASGKSATALFQAEACDTPLWLRRIHAALAVTALGRDPDGGLAVALEEASGKPAGP